MSLERTINNCLHMIRDTAPAECNLSRCENIEDGVKRLLEFAHKATSGAGVDAQWNELTDPNRAIIREDYPQAECEPHEHGCWIVSDGGCCTLGEAAPTRAAAWAAAVTNLDWLPGWREARSRVKANYSTAHSQLLSDDRGTGRYQIVDSYGCSLSNGKPTRAEAWIDADEVSELLRK